MTDGGLQFPKRRVSRETSCKSGPPIPAPGPTLGSQVSPTRVPTKLELAKDTTAHDATAGGMRGAIE